MVGIADKIRLSVGSTCVPNRIAMVNPNDPTLGRDCAAQQTLTGANGNAATSALPACTFAADNSVGNPPCYELTIGTPDCRSDLLFRACFASTCALSAFPAGLASLSISCKLDPQ